MTIPQHSIGVFLYPDNFFGPELADTARRIDALVAWGDEACIRDRIREHFDAGATQVQRLPTTHELFVFAARFARVFC